MAGDAITSGGVADGDNRAGDCACKASAMPAVGVVNGGAIPVCGGNGIEGVDPKSSPTGMVPLATAGVG